MTRRKKKTPTKAKPSAPRDPFWRLRRVLGARRIGSGKAYSRGDERRAARRAREEEA